MSSKLECPNCGYQLNQAERVCKYCGSLNSNFIQVNQRESNRQMPAILSQNNNNQSNTNNNSSSKNNNFGCLIFVLLLIFCWPAAIVYLIVKGFSK